jgi:Ca2+-transporting ATPase
LLSEGVIVGKDLEKMNDEELEEKLNSGINIFARVSPFDKLRILKILQKDYRVAMTGDGVNDALALKKADVGIAMGIRGTEVAKEASDMILLDDNFATIRDAIKEGRRVFDNIKKFLNYLLVCNFAEVGVLFLASILFTLNQPVLLPIQILWINLLTDGVPAIALGVDPPLPDVMRRPPRKKEEGIIDKKLQWQILLIGAKKTVVLMTLFFIATIFFPEMARSVIFTGFIIYEFVRIGAIRYNENLSIFANKWLILSLAVSVIFQLIVLYTPISQYFHVTALNLVSWLVLITGGLIGLISAILITDLINKFVKD